jgi:hypothetical protein
MQPIPQTLAPFFQEYNFPLLNPERDAPLVIERTLQYGNRAELHWLFAVYSQEKIKEWVRRYGNDRLPQPHRTFWRTIFGIPA